MKSVGDFRGDPDAYGTFSTTDAQQPARRSVTSVLRTFVTVGLLLFVGSFLLGFQDRSLGGHHGTAHETGIVWLEGIASPTTELSRVEQQFMDGIDTTKLREYLHAYASAPHVAGSKRDYETAVYTAKQLESFGINATIKEYYPLLSLPVRRRLAILEPQSAAQELNLNEAPVEGDACTSDATALPPFFAYAASGNVTASVVYANFGTRDDFQWLLEQDVTLKGKIALVRYGGNFRGLKVMAAEEHGMAGVLIYSDPEQDGFTQGDAYPTGPWRPAGSFQRGSIQYNSIAGGDPLTPGFPSNLGAPYLSVEESKTIPHIPALPLSYEQASIILKALGGKTAPASWQGALPIDGGYRLGDDGATILNLDLEMDNKIGPIWDVIGTIDGRDEADQQVIIGNHRDAWVCGAVDPSSGSAVLLEIARTLGGLLGTGWRPRRTLVLGSWDGEEYALLGSTEYAEDHAVALKQNAVAYINVDNVIGPYVSASGTPSIAAFLLDTARAVPANRFFGDETEANLYEQWLSQTAQQRASRNGTDDGTLGPDYLIGFLGAGTDFTPFYQHLGIISANLGFSIGPSMYGVYHSSMDSLKYLETFGDPHYETQAVTSKWWGLIALRLVDNPIVPFDFSTYGQIMKDALSGFEAQVAALERDVDFARLYGAIEDFSGNADSFQKLIQEFGSKYQAANGKHVDKQRRQLNAKLVSLERHLLSEDGLPHRPWFKHVIFGPGFYEGYSGTAFPGIADGIAFEDDSQTIQAHVDEVARVVNNAASFLKLG